MNLLIASRGDDKSAERIVEECRNAGNRAVNIPYSDVIKEDLKKYDFCILRDPYQIGLRFPEALKKIFSHFSLERFLNHKLYEKYPPLLMKDLHPQDKLLQYQKLKHIVKLPDFWYFRNIEEIRVERFPIIVKKRVSEMGKDVFILNSKEEVKNFFRNKNVEEYIFQEFINTKLDLRILVLNHKVIGAVRRTVRIKDRDEFQGIGVKVSGSHEVPKEIEEKSVLISKLFGCSFCGLDFIMDENEYYFLEINISPWFNSFERVTKINIAKRIVEFIQERVKAL